MYAILCITRWYILPILLQEKPGPIVLRDMTPEANHGTYFSCRPGPCFQVTSLSILDLVNDAKLLCKHVLCYSWPCSEYIYVGSFQTGVNVKTGCTFHVIVL